MDGGNKERRHALKRQGGKASVGRATKPPDNLGAVLPVTGDFSSSDRKRLFFRSSSAEFLPSHIGHQLLDGAKQENFETLHGPSSKVFRNSWAESAKRSNTTHQRHFMEHSFSEKALHHATVTAIAEDSREMRTTAYRDLAAQRGDTSMRSIHCAGHARFWHDGGIAAVEHPRASSASNGGIDRRGASGRASGRTAAQLDLAPAASRPQSHSKGRRGVTPVFWPAHGSPKSMTRPYAADSSSHTIANWCGV